MEEVTDLMRRTVLFRLPRLGRYGGIYTREQLAVCFRDKGIPVECIESSGPLFQRQNDWEVTIRKGNDAVVKRLMFEEVRMGGQVARVSSVLKSLVRVRVHGLPNYVPQHLVER